MNLIAKVLVSATLNLGMLAAHAANIETDYPGPFVTAPAERQAAGPAMRNPGYDGPAPLLYQDNQSGLVANPAYMEPHRSRDEVRREAKMPRSFSFVNA